MKITYDRLADAMYIAFADSPVHESEEKGLDVIVDYDRDHHIVGIEILNVSKRQPNFNFEQTKKDIQLEII
jgi:uncharacterized protein YuzE